VEGFWQQLLPEGGIPRIPLSELKGLVLCGMGGSGIVGSVARTLLLKRGYEKPVVTVKDYDLPPFVKDGYGVVCVSYSGNTEETLHNFRQALERGLPVWCVTSGGKLEKLAREHGLPVALVPKGLQPRFAFGYMFSRLLLMLGFTEKELKDGAEFLRAEQDGLKKLALNLAERLYGFVPALYATPLTAPAAHRWKAQLNENAKTPSHDAVLPELHHNELMGWSNFLLRDKFVYLLFKDPEDHERNLLRAELTEELLKELGHNPVVLEGKGETLLKRTLWLINLGDWVSVLLAGLYGYDPLSIPLIKQVKERLEHA